MSQKIYDHDGFFAGYSKLLRSVEGLAGAAEWPSLRALLPPGGHFVFSVEHPLYTAPSQPGWKVDRAGRKTWSLDGYLHEGPRTTDWLAPGVVKQHRAVGTYVDLLLRHGFVLAALRERGPSDEQIAEHPAWVDERHRPPFLLLGARVAEGPGARD